MTMPRVLGLGDDGDLRVTPPLELQALRQGASRVESLALTDEAKRLELAGEALELIVEAEAGYRIELALRCSPDDEERTLIIVDPAADEVRIDTRAASLDVEVWRPDPLVTGAERADVPVQRAPLMSSEEETLRLHIFVDRSIIEVFVNERMCLTGRAYPTRDDAIGITISGWGQARVEGWLLAAGSLR
jgi:beta-fructofuranosidase